MPAVVLLSENTRIYVHMYVHRSSKQSKSKRSDQLIVNIESNINLGRAHGGVV
jgi:hypothetical protein